MIAGIDAVCSDSSWPVAKPNKTAFKWSSSIHRSAERSVVGRPISSPRLQYRTERIHDRGLSDLTATKATAAKC